MRVERATRALNSDVRDTPGGLFGHVSGAAVVDGRGHLWSVAETG